MSVDDPQICTHAFGRSVFEFPQVERVSQDALAIVVLHLS
jgi:hypothetical protein